MCDQTPGCRSFAYYPFFHPHQLCCLKDRCVSGSDPLVSPAAQSAAWKTYYKSCWQVTARVVQNEGTSLGQCRRGSVSECQAMCDQTPGCRSFAYYPFFHPHQLCCLKDRCVSGSDPLVSPAAQSAAWVTYYNSCQT